MEIDIPLPFSRELKKEILQSDSKTENASLANLKSLLRQVEKSQNIPGDSEAKEDERNGRSNINDSLQHGVISCGQREEESEIWNTLFPKKHWP